MSFLSRFFRTNDVPKKTELETPDDSHLNRRVKEAKWRNSQAVHSFIEAAHKQESDANMARQVISDILKRAEDQKAVNDENNSGQK